MADRRAIEDFVSWQIQRRGLTPGYAYQCRQKLLSLAAWIGPLGWGELDEALLEQWAWRPRRSGQVGAASTIEKDLVVVSSFYAWLQRRGLAHANPSVEVTHPKVHNAHPSPITDETWRAWYVTPKYIEDDSILFMGLAYLCGLRLAEVLRLSSDHFLTSGQIVGLRVKGGREETQDVQALVQVVANGLPNLLPDRGDRFLSLLWRRVNAGGLIFDWTASARSDRRHELPDGENDPQWIYKRIRKWQRTANPRPMMVWRAHKLRHGFVTNLLRCGVPLPLVSVLACHSTPTVTMRYAKLGSQDLRQFVANQQRGDGWSGNRFSPI